MPSQDIWVHIETEGEDFNRTSLELLSGARLLAGDLGGNAVAVMLGNGVSDAARRLSAYGAERILIADDPIFSQSVVEAQADVLGQVLAEHMPAAILIPATLDGRDIAGRLAARLGAALLANASALQVLDGAIAMNEVAFDGALVITCGAAAGGTTIITVLPKAFELQEFSGQSPIEILAARPGLDSNRVRTLEIVRQASADSVPLEAARIIVAGGRGLGGPEPFAALKDLADALGGAVGASRAAVDAGWVPYAMQVGQTGKQVKPKAYIACGISGAIQHKVGMQNSATIIAINTDKEAPIFDFADLGIVGNALDIVPKLTEALRNRQ
jgi:electron transfer flavoprotein alpha subunit